MDRTNNKPGILHQMAHRYGAHPWKKLWLIISVMVALALGVTTTLAGYDAPGDLDTTFSVDGKVTTDFAGHYDSANSVAVQSDGKIVAVGSASSSEYYTFDFALARYNPNGSLDDNFS